MNKKQIILTILALLILALGAWWYTSSPKVVKFPSEITSQTYSISGEITEIYDTFIIVRLLSGKEITIVAVADTELEKEIHYGERVPVDSLRYFAPGEEVSVIFEETIDLNQEGIVAPATLILAKQQ